MLHELIYCSRANSNFKSTILDDILKVSRANNTKNHVTGLLIFDGTTFCQILEGEKAALDLTYEKIKKDDRHIDYTLFHSGQIESRNFEQWAMSFQRSQTTMTTASWTDWFSAQKQIEELSPDNSVGGLILKLMNGGASMLSGKNPLGVQ